MFRRTSPEKYRRLCRTTIYHRRVCRRLTITTTTTTPTTTILLINTITIHSTQSFLSLSLPQLLSAPPEPEVILLT